VSNPCGFHVLVMMTLGTDFAADYIKIKPTRQQV